MLKTEAVAELSRRREVVALAAAVAHTDESAKAALRSLGLSQGVIDILDAVGFTEVSGREWSIRSDLRKLVLSGATDNQDLWQDCHAYYLSSATDDQTSLPTYMRNGSGLAYHTAEIDPIEGLELYSAVALIESESVSVDALRMASEQSSRKILDSESVEIKFLRGMALYRTGDKGSSMRILREVALRSDRTHEVAVAQHLVGYWDCLHGKGASAQKMLRSSHKTAVRNKDEFHLAQVKHSMALCMLRDRRRPEQAEKYLRQSLALLEQIGDTWGIAMVQHTLGKELARRKQRSEARQLLQMSYKAGIDLGYTRHVESVEESMKKFGFLTRSNLS